MNRTEARKLGQANAEKTGETQAILFDWSGVKVFFPINLSSVKKGQHVWEVIEPTISLSDPFRLDRHTLPG